MTGSSVSTHFSVLLRLISFLIRFFVADSETENVTCICNEGYVGEDCSDLNEAPPYDGKWKSNL